MNLWPASVAALGHDPKALQPVIPGFEKRLYRLPHPPDIQPVPLRRVYILTEGAFGAEPLTMTEALPELVRHSYAIRTIWHAGRQAEHFRHVTQLLHQVPVCRLSRPLDLSCLDRVAKVIEDDVASTRNHPVGASSE